MPARHLYMASASALSLLPHVNALISWAKANKPAILKDRAASSPLAS